MIRKWNTFVQQWALQSWHNVWKCSRAVERPQIFVQITRSEQSLGETLLKGFSATQGQTLLPTTPETCFARDRQAGPGMGAGQHHHLEKHSPQGLGRRSAGPVAIAVVSHTPDTQRNPNQAQRCKALHNSPTSPGAELKCSSGPASTGGCPDGATQGSQSLLSPGKPLFKPGVTIPSGFRWIKLGPEVINEDLQWQCEMKNR